MHLPDALIQSNLCAALCTHFIELSYPNSISITAFLLLLLFSSLWSGSCHLQYIPVGGFFCDCYRNGDKIN